MLSLWRRPPLVHHGEPLPEVGKLAAEMVVGSPHVIQGPLRADDGQNQPRYTAWQHASVQTLLAAVKFRAHLKLFELLGEHAIALAHFCEHALEVLEALCEGLTVALP